MGMELEENLSGPLRHESQFPVQEPGPNDPPWNSFAALGAWFVSVLFILVIPSLFLLPYLATVQPPITETSKLIEFASTDPTSILLQIVAILPAHALTIVIAWLLVTRVRKYSFAETLGWNSGGMKWWHYIALLGGFFVVAALVGLVAPEQENDLLRILRSSRTAVYIVAFVATFTAPFVEEVVYRGILYSAFQRAMGVPAAIGLVTVLFAVVHVPQYWPSYSTMLLLTLLSLMLTGLRAWSGNLLPCVVLHTLFNGIQSLFLIIEPWMKAENTEKAASVVDLLR
jgi:uncharacterized protein